METYHEEFDETGELMYQAVQVVEPTIDDRELRRLRREARELLTDPAVPAWAKKLVRFTLAMSRLDETEPSQVRVLFDERAKYHERRQKKKAITRLASLIAARSAANNG